MLDATMPLLQKHGLAKNQANLQAYCCASRGNSNTTRKLIDANAYKRTEPCRSLTPIMSDAR